MTVGNASYVNQSTGEVEDFTVIKKNINQDFNFHKIWLQDLLQVLNTFGNAKIKVLTHLLKIMRNADNSVNFTYRSLSEDTGISYPTVNQTINELLNANVLKRDEKVKSLYVFNPDLIVKGNSDKRKRLLIEYNFTDDKTIENKAHAELSKTLDQLPLVHDTEIIIHKNQSNIDDFIKNDK